VPLTFTEVSYPLCIDGVTMLVDVRDEEATKMADNRPADAFGDDPLHD